ncbi:MAG TPA: hypothetical protein VF681_12860 [Abditibacteriaceae bacterium]|jgi:hypothetical protein
METNELHELKTEMAELRHSMNRSARRTRVGFAGVLMLGIVAGGAMTAQTQNAKNIVTVDELRVRGANGQTAAVVTSDKDGGMLLLLGADGKPRVSLVTDDFGGGVALTSKTGASVATLGGDKDGGLLGLNASAGKGTMAMAWDENGSGATFGDRAGNNRVVIAADNGDENARVVVLNSKSDVKGALPAN